jgi:protein phosphatase
MLAVVEEAYRSDTGRQRAANEDSFFARSPLFAVADGMGGAQAGEVASSTAAEAFEEAARGEGAPEGFLRSIAEGANRRIHDLAQADASRSGMGTTLTAALLEGEEISLAHVGDSRAYRFRDSELRLLTSDHSLVEELRRQGRLTDEQAEDHPQRSIITRALGPEPDVEVDTMTYRARPGDIYLLCSDGLTTMLKEPAIAAALRESESLEAAVSRLIGEANQAGGRDNITVVAFRLDDTEAPVGRGAPAPKPADAGATLVGPAAEDAGLTGPAVRERVAAASATGSGSLGGAAASPRREPPPSRRRRVVLRVVLPLLVLGVLAGGAVIGLRQVYFLGTDSGGRVALYRGLPYTLPLGIDLFSEVYAAPIQVSSLPAGRQTTATDHTLRGHDDAVNLIQDLTRVAKPPQPKVKPQQTSPQQTKPRQSKQRSSAKPSGGAAGSQSKAPQRKHGQGSGGSK